MLPEAITIQTIRDASTALDERHLDVIDDVMNVYIDRIVDAISVKHGLSEEQAEELANRIQWRLDLLPVTT